MTTSSIATIYSSIVFIGSIGLLPTLTAAMAAEPMRIVPHASIVDTISSRLAQAVDGRARVADAASDLRARAI